MPDVVSRPTWRDLARGPRVVLAVFALMAGFMLVSFVNNLVPQRQVALFDLPGAFGQTDEQIATRYGMPVNVDHPTAQGRQESRQFGIGAEYDEVTYVRGWVKVDLLSNGADAPITWAYVYPARPDADASEAQCLAAAGVTDPSRYQVLRIRGVHDMTLIGLPGSPPPQQ